MSDKILENRACEIARSHKYDGYQRALAGMVYKFFDIGLCEISRKYLSSRYSRNGIIVFKE